MSANKVANFSSAVSCRTAVAIPDGGRSTRCNSCNAASR
ncbi:MAG: hypothetical protein KKD00_12140 [Gammaproteobacteria bacterium]|nr:hypothetical protein [Gammaproteobacteria bacterium]